MNERMKELAKQLGYNVNYKPSDDETDREYQVVSNDFAEKFAELIVKECYVALFPALRDMISRGQAYDLIKQHFGVE